MHIVPTIPGVTLEVYKETNRLTPENDGYLGKLYSGSATILAIVDPNAAPTIAYYRDGQDHYQKAPDWIRYVSLVFKPQMEDYINRQKRMMGFLEGRSFAAGARVHGITMPLRRVQENPFNTVHYPENMFALAQYVQNGDQLTGRVHVWEVAIVSQNGEFFLTVHRHYNISACKGLKSPICFPRVQGHRLLERLLVENAPEGLPLVPAQDIIPLQRPESDKTLGRYEGIVENWYVPRNMGAIITAQGMARVHWSDVPARPRLRFLKEGERVKFAELREPPENPRTEWRVQRKARFDLQACAIELV